MAKTEEDINKFVSNLTINNKKIQQTENQYDSGYSYIDLVGKKTGSIESLDLDPSKFKQHQNVNEYDYGYNTPNKQIETQDIDTIINKIKLSK